MWHAAKRFIEMFNNYITISQAIYKNFVKIHFDFVNVLLSPCIYK